MITLIDTLGLGNKKARLMEYFLKNPTKEIHIRSLARTLKMSSTWVAKSARELEKKELLLIKQHKERKEVSVKANRENPIYTALKQTYNLYSIYASGLQSHLIKSRPECIILFGSFAKGEDIETSDIDIAIITPRKTNKDLASYEQQLEKKIAIKELTKERIGKEFWKTLANGIVLYGYLEVPV